MRTTLVGLVGFALASLAFTWPLARHFSSRLMGPPGSDLGVYVWNLWVFRHEVLAGRFPLSTGVIFSLDTPADLSLHNYTLASDLVAAPLLPLFGVVASYNLVSLLNLTAAAMAMFLLAFHVTRRAPVAWLCGLLFAFSPPLVTRSTIHPSLSAAAPLPLFVYILIRLNETRSRLWAVAGGATLAWATLSDPYYGVYCVVLAVWYLATRALRVERARTERGGTRLLQRATEVVAGVGLLVAAVIAVSGGTRFVLGGLVIGLTTAYTPAFVASVALAARVLMSVRIRILPPSEWVGLVRLAPHGAVTALLLLAPLLGAVGVRAWEGRYVAAPVLWRSSTPGVDLASLLMPNPNNPWLGAAWRTWLAREPNGFEENVASMTVVAALIILVAVWRAGFRAPALWGSLALLAGSLTLGPFVRVAGVNTCVPTPWALVRYLPLVGSARAPARFAVLLMLAVAVLVGLALVALIERFPARRRVILGAAGVLLVAELCPVPRPLYDASIPAIYDRIARDRRDVRVLELPFGVRDGLSSYGNFSAASQFYQTHHGKRLIGGYLSRVSHRRVESARRRPVLAALAALSEGRPIAPGQLELAALRGGAFVRNSQIGYVVIDRSRASESLIEFAIRALNLEKIGEAGERDLYRPRPAGFLLATDRFEPAGDGNQSPGPKRYP